MSKCISIHGEYSEHNMSYEGDVPLGEFVCTRCYAFDEDAALKELVTLRALIVEAGLETYTPDGSERVAAHLTEQQRIITGLRDTITAVRLLADEFDAISNNAYEAQRDHTAGAVSDDWLDGTRQTAAICAMDLRQKLDIQQGGAS